MKSKRKAKIQKDEFHRGFACAIGTLARDHDMPSVAVDIMRTNGVTLEDLKYAGAEHFDLAALKKEISSSPSQADITFCPMCGVRVSAGDYRGPKGLRQTRGRWEHANCKPHAAARRGRK